MFLYFVVVVVADSIRHHSASASDAAGLGEKFSSEHLDKDENDLIAAAKGGFIECLYWTLNSDV